MALKVLLADDNITAQRMGSKILSDAGYTVVAVSNGAAAVKKIAAERPDLAILDVFMPGYTGLEVCEKIKNAVETARMAVLLTVTNMEPYSAADGNRVKADGVLIKPFEATDLLAVMHKFEEKLQTRALTVEKPAPAAEEEEQSEAEVATTDSVSKPVEMPQELASAPALGVEELESPAAEAAPLPEAVPEVAAGVAAPVPEAEPGLEAPVAEAAAVVVTPVALPDSVVEAPAEAVPVVETTVAEPEPVVEAPAAKEAEFIETPAMGEAALEMEPPVVTEAEAEVPAVGEPGAEVPAVAAEPPAVEEMQPAEAVEVQTFDVTAPVQMVSEAAVEPQLPSEDLRAETPSPQPEAAEIVPAAEAEFRAAPDSAPAEVVPATEGQEGPMYGLGMGPDPLLAGMPEDFAEFATKFGGEHAEDIPIGIAMDTNAAEALEAIPELLVEPIDGVEEPIPEVADSASAAEVAEGITPGGETFEVREPVAEPEPEPEPEHDTQRVHGELEEPEYESRHIHPVDHSTAEELHDAPAVTAEAEQEAPQVAASVEQEAQELELVAAAEAPSIVEEEPAQETATVEQAEEEEQAWEVQEPDPEMPQTSDVVEEHEHYPPEFPMAGEAEAASAAMEAPVAVSEAPSALEAQVAEELARAQAEMVAVAEPATAEPEMEPPAEAAAAPLATMNEERVAEAVHRVLDRYKGELIAAIVSELKK